MGLQPNFILARTSICVTAKLPNYCDIGTSLHEATERLHGGTDCAPVHWFAIVAFLQEVLMATIVGMLVEDPVTIQNFAGMDLSQTEPLHHRWTVFNGLYGLACEVRLVVQLNLVLHSTCLRGLDVFGKGVEIFVFGVRINESKW